jgi:hypothetical protein
MSQIHSVKIESSSQKSMLTTFFEKHDTTRKIVAYIIPLFFVGAGVIDQFTSYKLFPRNSIAFGVSLGFMFSLSGFAKSCDESLENRNIERLNKPESKYTYSKGTFLVPGKQ